MRSVSAAAFDLDGTLYPNYRLYVRLIPFILREWRLLWAFGKARDHIRKEGEQTSPPLHPDFYDYQSRLIAGMLGAEPALIKAKIERLIYRGWERHFTRVKLFSHAAETLAALRAAGLRLGLLSDFPPETKLAHLGIGDLWDAVLCTEQIGVLKPDRRPFDLLASALDLAPERILYVGNSRRYDVMGAKRAGMKTALITGFISETGGHTAAGEDSCSPDFVFHDYRQLLDYVLN
jgi:putative hydrolase of the HAD superfamily